jgi:hypothetical protein
MNAVRLMTAPRARLETLHTERATVRWDLLVAVLLFLAAALR